MSPVRQAERHWLEMVLYPMLMIALATKTLTHNPYLHGSDALRIKESIFGKRFCSTISKSAGEHY